MKRGYRLIEDEQALLKTCYILSRKKILAVDFEMENNLHRYGTHLALGQISDGKHTWIIDLKKIKNAEPLKRIMEDRKITKVFHDADFDMRTLDLILSCHAKNIFDTKIAAELLGLPELGLGSLLKEHFKVKKDSKAQRFDWTRRPLTPRMLSYAAKDVRYLIRLKKILENELKKKKRMKWAEEEFILLENIRHEEKENPHLIKGTKSMTGRERAIIRKVFDAREKIARKMDRPSFQIIGNKRLLEIAKNPPASINEWKSTKGLSWIAKKYAGKIFEAIKKGKTCPEEKKECKTRSARKPIDNSYLDEIKEKRNRIAEKLELEPHIIMNNHQMEDIARGENPGDVLKRWQYTIFEKK